MLADILPWEAQRKFKISKKGKKIIKIENQPKIHFAFFWGILACTMVFHTSKKFPSLADYLVKRIFRNIHIWPRNKRTKLGRELWDTLYIKVPTRDGRERCIQIPKHILCPQSKSTCKFKRWPLSFSVCRWHGPFRLPLSAGGLPPGRGRAVRGGKEAPLGWEAALWRRCRPGSARLRPSAQGPPAAPAALPKGGGQVDGIPRAGAAASGLR